MSNWWAEVSTLQLYMINASNYCLRLKYFSGSYLLCNSRFYGIFIYFLEEFECSVKLAQTEIRLLMWSLVGKGAASLWDILIDSKSQTIQIYLKQSLRMFIKTEKKFVNEIELNFFCWTVNLNINISI